MSRNEEAFMAGLISGFTGEGVVKEAGAASKIMAKLKGAAGKAKDVVGKNPKKASFAAGAGVSALLQKILGRKNQEE